LLPPQSGVPRAIRAVPDWSVLHQEPHLPGVTLMLLWEEYNAAHPEGFRYSLFCEHYRAWAGKLDSGNIGTIGLNAAVLFSVVALGAVVKKSRGGPIGGSVPTPLCSCSVHGGGVGIGANGTTSGKLKTRKNGIPIDVPPNRPRHQGQSFGLPG
jgi:hypothetical protein